MFVSRHVISIRDENNDNYFKDSRINEDFTFKMAYVQKGWVSWVTKLFWS